MYLFSLKLFKIFASKIYSITLDPDPGPVPGSGSGSKLGQNPESGSKFNAFGSTTLLKTNSALAPAFKSTTSSLCAIHRYLIEGIIGVGGGAQVQLLEDHHVHGEGAGLV